MPPLTATVLFDLPHHELASQLGHLLRSCEAAWIVTGFATPEGIALLIPHLGLPPQRLKAFVVGAATQRALDAFDDLLLAGVPGDRLLIHLGHNRLKYPRAAHTFHKYHPMLHSKIYLFDLPGDTSVAIIGSHNATGFALTGLNAEAAIRLEGPSDHPEFQKVRDHIDECCRQAVVYAPDLKEGYIWWHLQYLDGLKKKTEDRPREDEQASTLIVLCQAEAGRPPKATDVIYLEVPDELRMKALQADVHIYVFDRLPSSPDEALASLSTARYAFQAKTLGLEDDSGGIELQADWEVTTDPRPVLRPVRKPFRPTLSRQMQQVRVKLLAKRPADYEYFFNKRRQKWIPQLDTQEVVSAREHSTLLAEMRLDPGEDREFYRVVSLVPEGQGDKLEQMVERRASPKGGQYVLLSLRRQQRRE